MKFLGMGVPELLIILVVVLLIFGPKNLPKLGSAIGKSVKSLREGMTSDEGKPEIDLDEDEEVEEEPKKKAVKAAKKVLKNASSLLAAFSTSAPVETLPPTLKLKRLLKNRLANLKL